MKRIVIVAGPNGAGKTTFAKEYLPREAACPNFINVDLIAAGLSPFDPAGAAVQAGRLMIMEIRRYLQEGDSFAFETTLAGRAYALHIPDWQSAGYRVELIFLKLRSIGLAISRVQARVAQGASRQDRVARPDLCHGPADRPAGVRSVRADGGGDQDCRRGIGQVTAPESNQCLVNLSESVIIPLARD